MNELKKGDRVYIGGGIGDKKACATILYTRREFRNAEIKLDKGCTIEIDKIFLGKEK